MEHDFGPIASRRRKLILGAAVIVAVLAFLGLLFAGFGSPARLQQAASGDREPVGATAYWYMGIGTLIVIAISVGFHWLLDRRQD
jgi:hypothetical protein